MNRLTPWIKKYQVVAFFALTFLITWGLGFSYIAVYRGMDLLVPLAFIAACGPALAGVAITAIANPQPKRGTRKAFWTAFLIAWVLSALVFLANNSFINHAPLSPIMLVFTLVSVAPVAFVISMAYSRLPPVRRYLSSLVRLRGVWGWSLLALVLTPALALLSIPISSLLGRQVNLANQLPTSGLALIGLIAVKFTYQLFFFNATGEETGWRGFALPRMQTAVSPLVACLVLNILWALWHLFLWIAEEQPVFAPRYWVQTYLELLPGTLILGWLYNRSKGSILVAGIDHAAANTAFWLIPNLDWLVFVCTIAVAALAMILVDRMWKKLPADHPAVIGSPTLTDTDIYFN